MTEKLKRFSELSARPEMPAIGMSLTEWAEAYRRPLSDYFRQIHGHYADEIAWLRFIDEQYKYQLSHDEALEGL